MIRWAELVTLFQENDQMGRELSTWAYRWNPSSKRMIKWAGMESLFLENDQVDRDGVSHPRE
jgi:hypothetical protein